ncbi:hypothetical protein ABPG72_021819 [Tetrahymena utriculariae]
MSFRENLNQIFYQTLDSQIITFINESDSKVLFLTQKQSLYCLNKNQNSPKLTILTSLSTGVGQFIMINNTYLIYGSTKNYSQSNKITVQNELSDSPLVKLEQFIFNLEKNDTVDQLVRIDNSFHAIMLTKKYIQIVDAQTGNLLKSTQLDFQSQWSQIYLDTLYYRILYSDRIVGVNVYDIKLQTIQQGLPSSGNSLKQNSFISVHQSPQVVISCIESKYIDTKTIASSLYLEQISKLIMKNNKFILNLSYLDGGTIYLNQIKEIIFVDNNFQENQSLTGNVGAVYCFNSVFSQFIELGNIIWKNIGSYPIFLDVQNQLQDDDRTSKTKLENLQSGSTSTPLLMRLIDEEIREVSFFKNTSNVSQEIFIEFGNYFLEVQSQQVGLDVITIPVLNTTTFKFDEQELSLSMDLVFRKCQQGEILQTLQKNKICSTCQQGNYCLEDPNQMRIYNVQNVELALKIAIQMLFNYKTDTGVRVRTQTKFIHALTLKIVFLKILQISSDTLQGILGCFMNPEIARELFGEHHLEEAMAEFNVRDEVVTLPSTQFTTQTVFLTNQVKDFFCMLLKFCLLIPSSSIIKVLVQSSSCREISSELFQKCSTNATLFNTIT